MLFVVHQGAHSEFYCLCRARAGYTVGEGLCEDSDFGLSVVVRREEGQENFGVNLSAGEHEENGELHWDLWTVSDLVSF